MSVPAETGIHQRVTKEILLSRCDFFTETQVWPLKRTLDPESWLDNFDKGDEDYACHLLNGFLFFPEPIVKTMFISAFQSLSHTVCGGLESFEKSHEKWQDFLGRAIIVHVTGETPNPTDSGHLFARILRDYAGIHESQVMPQSEAVDKLIEDPSHPLVFVDDFIGSGSQFVQTWERSHDVRGKTYSIKDIAERSEKGGFDINGCNNGLLMDVGEDMMQHMGPHISYNKALLDAIGDIDADALTPSEAAQAVQGIADIAREAIESETFPPNNSW